MILTRIVEVEWEDSMSMFGWRDRQHVLDELGAGGQGDTIKTVGYVLRDDPDKPLLLVMSAIQEDDGSVDGATAIPRSQVRQIRALVPVPEQLVTPPITQFTPTGESANWRPEDLPNPRCGHMLNSVQCSQPYGHEGAHIIPTYEARL